MYIHINTDNINSQIETPIPQDLVLLLCQELRYHPDGYQHVYKYTSGRWDGYNIVFNCRDNSFRRGLLDRVVALLSKAGHNVHVEYHAPQAPEVKFDYNAGIIRPYDFQMKAVEAGINNNIGLIVAPTGAGKTVCIGSLINAVKTPTMVIVTDIVLLDQMQQALQRYFNNPIGMIGDSEFDLQDITVATVQSLASISKAAKDEASAQRKNRFLGWVKRVGMVISDEAHLSDTASFNTVMPIFTNANRFIGFSATPYGWAEKAEKRQNIELEQHFGQVIYDCRKLDFIALGLKVPLIVNTIRRDPVNKYYLTHKKRDRRGKLIPDLTKNYRQALETELLNNGQYHQDIARAAWDLISTGKSVFIHAQHSIEFGKRICELVPGAVLVNGSTPRIERRRIYDAIRNKELLAMVSDVGGAGLDIPSLNALILASDITDVRQLKGRVERKHPSKQDALLVDFCTDTQFLLKHYGIRRYQYENDANIVVGDVNLPEE